MYWLKLGFISFGGPAGQIAIMHADLVEKCRWISEQRFLHALNYCMLLPGPEATQLAVYIGWLLHRTWGGIIAGTLFVLPSLLIAIAIGAFAAIAILRLPFPLIVLSAAAIGFAGGCLAPSKFHPGGAHSSGAKISFGPALIDDDTPPPGHVRFS